MLLTQTNISEKEIKAYAKKHIASSDDLLRWFPRKYRDYRKIKSIAECEDGKYAAVRARMIKSEVRDGARMKYLRLTFLCEAQDAALQNTYFNVDLFNKYTGYLAKIYSEFQGRNVIVTGKVSVHPVYGYSMQDTEVFHEHDFKNEIKAVYPKIGGVEDVQFRKHLDYFISMSGEILEEEVRKKYELLSYKEALEKIHCPGDFEQIDEAVRQFVFYDLLLFCMRQRKISRGMSDTSDAVMTDPSLTNSYLEMLPHPLTELTEEERKNADHDILCGGQREAVLSMMQTMASGKRLNALIEGDVGCGKTIVAACMLMFAAGNGFQAAILAPKTVLARQHYEEIRGYCDGLGLRCVFIGNAKTAEEKKQRKEDLKGIKDGSVNIIVGTHACFSKSVEYKNLGLIIYDEEQAFGADQKVALYGKAVRGVHTIEMSATPIPRSLTMSVFSDKNIIRITKKPEGRVKIQTAACNNDKPAFEFVEKQLLLGRQCYVVAPAIEDNEDFGLTGAVSVAKKYEKYFSPRGRKVVTANGRMTDDEFADAIDQFRKGSADILVATTVIEVGVNIPNTTVIVIEQAERFGLSQLHQLRGRVGRRDYPSYCILMTKDKQNPRIKAMTEMSDGFEIAEADYRLRGPGDINGTEQSGENKYINEILTYPEIYEKAKETAKMYDKDPLLGSCFMAAYDVEEN